MGGSYAASASAVRLGPGGLLVLDALGLGPAGADVDEGPGQGGADERDERAEAQAAVERRHEGLLDRAADAAAHVDAAGAEPVGELLAALGGQLGQELVELGAAQAGDEGAHDGDAEGAADHPAHGEDAGGHARLGRVDAVHGGGRHGGHDEAHPEAHQDEGADEEAEARRRGQVALPEQRRGHRHQAGGHERPRADPVRQAPGDRPDDDDHDGRGQEAHAGLQRRVALDVLQVQGEEEEHRQHREGHDEGHEVRAQERPGAEEREVDHRLGAAALDEHEAHEPDGGDGEEGDDAAGAPAPGVALDEREHERGEADGDRGHACVVDDVRRGLVARLVRRPQGHRRRPRRRPAG